MENIVLFILQRETYFQYDFLQGYFVVRLVFWGLFPLLFCNNQLRRQYYILI